MKKAVVMVMAGIMLVAMAACGKDAGANQPQSDLTADEELEMLNAEINARIEAAQREEEERKQQLEEGYPEGVFPPARYICRGLLDEESDIYIDRNILGAFDVHADDRYIYEYDIDTKTYIFSMSDASKYSDGPGRFRHHFEGYLNDEDEFVVTYYARYKTDILYETVGTITGENLFDRYEEEYPEVADIVLDDIEWVYVIYE